MPSVSVFVQKKDIMLKEREQTEQSEGRKAAQWYNSTMHEVSETNRLNLTWEDSIKIQAVQHFFKRFRDKFLLLQRHRVTGQAQEGHSVCFETSTLQI